MAQCAVKERAVLNLLMNNIDKCNDLQYNYS